MTTTARPRIDARTRLESLPATFNLDSVQALCGGSRADASIYCLRWKRMGLIRPMVYKTVGYYFNLVHQEAEEMETIQSAYENEKLLSMSRILKRPIVMSGVETLREHGWTTQRMNIYEFNVEITRGHTSLPKFQNVHLIPRYPTWFNKLQEASESTGRPWPQLRPEMVVADALLGRYRQLGTHWKEAWCPDPEDIDNLNDEKVELIEKALMTLGATSVELETLLEDFKSKPACAMK